MIRYQTETEIFFNDAQRNLPESVYKRDCWTELFVQWSPHGSYVATLHRQGVAIWGGTSFQRLMRFSHQNVGTLFKFSASFNKRSYSAKSCQHPFISAADKTVCKLQ